MALVLVVDDEAPVRQLVGHVIRQAGHEVMEAESSDAALAVMAQRAADVVFTDIQMPGRDGRWLTLEIRTRYPLSAVVLATSVTNLEPSMTLRFGVLSYLVKPFDARAIRRALETAVAWHEETAASELQEPQHLELGAWLDSLDTL